MFRFLKEKFSVLCLIARSSSRVSSSCWMCYSFPPSQAQVLSRGCALLSSVASSHHSLVVRIFHVCTLYVPSSEVLVVPATFRIYGWYLPSLRVVPYLRVVHPLLRGRTFLSRPSYLPPSLGKAWMEGQEGAKQCQREGAHHY